MIAKPLTLAEHIRYSTNADESLCTRGALGITDAAELCPFILLLPLIFTLQQLLYLGQDRGAQVEFP